MTAERKEISKPISNKQDSAAAPSQPLGEGDKYAVGQYMYPIDLMTEQYGGNYAVFYVNITHDSKLVPNAKNLTLSPEIEPRNRPDIVAKPISVSALTGSAAVLNTLGSAGKIAGVGAAGVASGSSFLGKTLLGAAGVGGATALSNLPTVGLGVIAASSPETTRTKRKTAATIALHVPNQLSVRYSMQWSDEDTANMQMMETGAQEVINALKSKSKSATEGIVDVAKTTGLEIAQNVALSKGVSGISGGALSAKLGIAANPKKEQVFRGVDFRTFTFDYQFFPRSEKEAEMVLNIIGTFKFHMHPEFKSANHFVFIYPSEFDIMYYTNGKENRSIHRHTSCVLTDMSVNYTPNGSFTTFDNGMPTQINMQLTFKELLILTKEQIKKGL